MRRKVLSVLLVITMLLTCVPLGVVPEVEAASVAQIPADAVEFNGHYYRIYANVCNTWEQALTYCENLGGHLATITTKEEDDELYSYVCDSGYSDCFFGFTDKESEGQWVWVTGEETSYTNWYKPKEPNNEYNENYGMYYHMYKNGQWNDEANFDDYPVFICEWESDDGVTSLDDMPIVDHGSYQGNQGDSTIFNLDGNGLSMYDKGERFNGYGNVGVDGTTYTNGFEAWIARWNFTNEISWAYATFDIGSKYQTLTGKTNLIRSYNTSNFDTTVYFYDGDKLLASYNLTPSDYIKDINVNVEGVKQLKMLVKDNVAVKGGTSFALHDMFLYGEGNLSEETLSDERRKQEKYLQQHIDFVYSETYNTVSNNFRYATTLWNNYHGSTSQAWAEAVYDVMEGSFEAISFQELSSLENPYDAILLDLLSAKIVRTSLEDAVNSNFVSIVDSVAGDLITMFQAESDWADSDIVDNFKDLLDLEPSDYSSNELYKSLDKLFEGKKTEQINSLFNKYDCFSNVLANIKNLTEGVDYFLEILRYTATIEAYYSASTEFKMILKEVADVIPTVNENYGKKFIETYNNYSSCVDYDSIMNNVLNHVVEEGVWLVNSLMSDVLQDAALSFCKSALKMSEQAAGNLVAALWAAETGFNLANLITKNDTLVNCRRMLRANYMLDNAVHYVMSSHANTLRVTPDYEEALLFDAAFNVFKNLQ